MYLIFDGLDSFADIYICEQKVATTANQFRQYVVNVTSAMAKCPHGSMVRIVFTSPRLEAIEQAKQQNCSTCIGINQQLHEFPDIQYIRKQQLDFGWDFAPAYSPIGIWKSSRAVVLDPGETYGHNCAIDIYRKNQINNLPPDQSQPWVVNVTVDYIGFVATDTSIAAEIRDSSGRLVARKSLTDISISRGNATSGQMSGSLVIFEPVELWWPVGYGDQNLYDFTIQIQHRNKTLWEVEKRTGFRTIVLDQRAINDDEVDLGFAPGSKFNFEINGRVIFCKGSNLVPPDVFWPRVTREWMERIFTDVVDGVRQPDYQYISLTNR